MGKHRYKTKFILYMWEHSCIDIYLYLLTENASMKYWKKHVMNLPIQLSHSVHWKVATKPKTTEQNYSFYELLNRLRGNIS